MALFPFGCNFVYFISQGMEHDLMTFSFAVAPLLVFPLLSMDEEVGGGLLTKRKNVVYACFALTVFSNVIFANQIYVKKDLEAKSTLSVVTRIIDRIERTEGYVAGETEVCIIGGLEENPLVISKRAGFDYSGTGNQAWVPQPITLSTIFPTIWHIHIKSIGANVRLPLPIALKCFPKKIARRFKMEFSISKSAAANNAK